MADDLTDRIQQKVDHWRWRMPEYAQFSDHAEKVLARHKPIAKNFGRRHGWCNHCQTAYPCPDVRDLADCWGVSLTAHAEGGKP